MNTNLLIEIIGWGGASMILGAYALSQFKYIAQHSKTYQLLNIFGSIGFVINSGFHGAYPNAFMNTIWTIIALYALYKLLHNTNR